MATDYTKDELEIVVGLVREENENKPLTLDQVTFSEPQAIVPNPKNTMVAISAVPRMGYGGSQVFYYDRVPLTDFLQEGVDTITIQKGSENLLSELLPRINERLAIKLAADKIEDQLLPVSEEPVIVTLAVRNTSHVYSGSIRLRVVPLSYL